MLHIRPHARTTHDPMSKSPRYAATWLPGQRRPDSEQQKSASPDAQARCIARCRPATGSSAPQAAAVISTLAQVDVFMKTYKAHAVRPTAYETLGNFAVDPSSSVDHVWNAPCYAELPATAAFLL